MYHYCMPGHKMLKESKSKYVSIAADRETHRKLRILSMAYNIQNKDIIKLLVDAVWDREMGSDKLISPIRKNTAHLSPQSMIANEAKDTLRELGKPLD